MPQIVFAMLLLFCSGLLGAQETQVHQRVIGPFDRKDAPSHQARLQAALDAPLDTPRTYVLAPGEYRLSDPAGLRIPADSTLDMRGARLVFEENMAADGQALLLEGVSNMTLLGGEITGKRDAWDPGVNIAGVRVRGDAHDIAIAELRCVDLSSNAVGVFGAGDDAPIRGVTLRHVTAINCCNFYGDYLSDHVGPAPGSVREDQGTVAFYYVDGWLVTGCRFEHSQSDGTHFYHAHNGRFVDCVVADSKMGGYFLEGCEQVVASGNLIQRNGSRGVTIERDSRYCTLENNLVALSGREGLWAPDVECVIVSGNIFRENGQKDDAARDSEIRLDDGEKYPTRTADIRIEGNIFQTSAHQLAAVYVGNGVEDFTLGENTFRGSAPMLFREPAE